MLSMGKSTISTGPFSIAMFQRLPEGSSYFRIRDVHWHYPLDPGVIRLRSPLD